MFFVSRKILISFGIVFLTNLKNANEINGPKVKSDRLLDGIIRPVLADFSDFRVKRADQDARPGLIDVQMINAASPIGSTTIGLQHDGVGRDRLRLWFRSWPISSFQRYDASGHSAHARAVWA
jgi:hypothetical protein